MNDSKMAWVTSAGALVSAGTGLILGAPMMIGTGIVGAVICGSAAIIEDHKIAKQLKPFKTCGVHQEYKQNGDKYYIYPSIIKHEDNYTLIGLPDGMDLKDVEKAHGALEAYYGKKILIKQSNNKKVLIKRLDPEGCEEDKWLCIFSKIKMIGNVGDYPILIKNEMNSVGQKVVFDMPPGMTIDDFVKKQQELEYQLKMKIEIRSEGYKVAIQTIAREFKNLYRIDFKNDLKDGMQFYVGVGRGEEPLTVDLGGNEFSTLVCGSSGSGKSVFLNCLMAQMILKDVEIRAIDLKAVEFAIFKRYKNMSKYAINKKDAIKVLMDTYDLMQERYKELEEKSCKSYADYNKRFNNSMPPTLLIIDEFSALMGDKKANYFLFELLSRARASNILVVICTQTPRSKILDGTIRCNIKNTICFSCETDTDSEVALGQKGNFRAARELNEVGRGFLKSKKELIEFQGYFLTDEQINSQIAHKLVPKNQCPWIKQDHEAAYSKQTSEQVIAAIDNL